MGRFPYQDQWERQWDRQLPVAVKNLWILNSDGLCLLHRSFAEGKTIDETLFGGFLTAIVHMTRDLAGSDQTIEKIQMGTVNLHYRPIKEANVAFVLAVDRNFSEKEITKIMNALAFEFQLQFEDFLKTGHRVIDTSVFAPFEQKIDQIIAFRGKTIKIEKQNTEFHLIMERVKRGELVPEDAISQILNLYERIENTDTKKQVAAFLKESDKLLNTARANLSDQQRKMIEMILKTASRRMKVEKFLMGF